jgi:uncharacterized RDD family membrane protein YckC
LPFFALGYKINPNGTNIVSYQSFVRHRKENCMKRPFGVTVSAILALIGGLFGLCWPTLAFMGSALLPGVFGTIGAVAGVFLIVGPILQLIFSYGAFKLRSWAWYLGLIATGITVIGVVINLINGASIFSALLGSFLSIIIFIYLLMPNVRKAFEIGGEKTEAMESAAPAAPPPPAETPAAPAEAPAATPAPAEAPDAESSQDEEAQQ